MFSFVVVCLLSKGFLNASSLVEKRREDRRVNRLQRNVRLHTRIPCIGARLDWGPYGDNRAICLWGCGSTRPPSVEPMGASF